MKLINKIALEVPAVKKLIEAYNKNLEELTLLRQENHQLKKLLHDKDVEIPKSLKKNDTEVKKKVLTVSQNNQKSKKSILNFSKENLPKEEDDIAAIAEAALSNNIYGMAMISDDMLDDIKYQSI